MDSETSVVAFPWIRSESENMRKLVCTTAKVHNSSVHWDCSCGERLAQWDGYNRTCSCGAVYVPYKRTAYRGDVYQTCPAYPVTARE